MPAIWVVIFFYALLDRSLGRVAIVMTAIAVIHLIALRGYFVWLDDPDRGEAVINLKARETRTLVAVHGWAGAVLGLLLYAVIVTGTAAVFANEIKAWSGGLLGTSDPMSQPLNAVLARLEAETPKEFHEDLPLRATPAGNVQAFFHADETVDGARSQRGILYTIGPNGRVISRQRRLRQGPRGQRSLYGARTLLRRPARAAACAQSVGTDPHRHSRSLHAGGGGLGHPDAPPYVQGHLPAARTRPAGRLARSAFRRRQLDPAARLRAGVHRRLSQLFHRRLRCRCWRRSHSRATCARWSRRSTGCARSTRVRRRSPVSTTCCPMRASAPARRCSAPAGRTAAAPIRA